jgi:hypothetical protein
MFYNSQAKLIDLPDYLNDDAAAMSLLDTLVEKGFSYSMGGNNLGVHFCIYGEENGEEQIWFSNKPTRRAAVVAAVLELIGKEDV